VGRDTEGSQGQGRAEEGAEGEADDREPSADRVETVLLPAAGAGVAVVVLLMLLGCTGNNTAAITQNKSVYNSFDATESRTCRRTPGSLHPLAALTATMVDRMVSTGTAEGSGSGGQGGGCLRASAWAWRECESAWRLRRASVRSGATWRRERAACACARWRERRWRSGGAREAGEEGEARRGRGRGEEEGWAWYS
jgi:hypothetical protein